MLRAALLAPGDDEAARDLNDAGLSEEEHDEVVLAAILCARETGGRRSLAATADAALARFGAARARRRGDRARAIDALQRVVAAAPDDVEGWAGLAEAGLAARRPELALQAARSGLLRRPRAVDLHLLHAAALERLGKQGAAEQARLAAWRLQPGSPEAAASLANEGWSEADLERLAAATWARARPGAVETSGPTAPEDLVGRARAIWTHLAVARS